MVIVRRTAITGGILSLMAFSSAAYARDMQGRFGLGYNSELANSSTLQNSVPGISIKYALSRDLAFEGIVGVATSTPKTTATGMKFFKNIFFETNLNFYGFLGGAVLSAGGTTGAQFLGGFGSEFFIPGVESLGFSIETGASLDNMSGHFVLRTMGVSFLDAGIHFYF
jgi:hypothetical protein